MSNVGFLPIWKKRSTPEEFFMECAAMVRTHPGWGRRIVVVAQEDDGQNMKTRVWRHEADTLQTMGMLEIGKIKFWSET